MRDNVYIVNLEYAKKALDNLNDPDFPSIDTHALVDMLFELYVDEVGTTQASALDYLIKHDVLSVDDQHNEPLMLALSIVMSRIQDLTKHIFGNTNHANVTNAPSKLFGDSYRFSATTSHCG